MRRSLIAVTVATAALFGAGTLISQLHGASPALAATKHAAKTKKAKAGRASGTQTNTSHADGKVTAVNGNTITVQPDNDRAGSNEYTKVTTIVLTGATTYKGNTTKASIVVGAMIVAEGSVSSDGTTLTATSVGVGGPGGHHGRGPGGPHADGTIVSVSGNMLTVKPDADSANSNEYTKVTTVLLTGSTQFRDSTTAASIVVGSEFNAEGTLSADGTTLTATAFEIHAAGAGPHSHSHP